MLMLYICCGFGSEDDASLNPQVEGNKLQRVPFLFKRGKVPVCGIELRCLIYNKAFKCATQGTMPRSCKAGIKKIINRLKGKSGVNPALSP